MNGNRSFHSPGICYTIGMTTQHTVMSMTGYAQSEGQTGNLNWRLELKSVNSKGFDLRCRLPSGFDTFETAVRSLVTQKIKRGSLTLGLHLQAAGGAKGARLNRALLDDVLKAAKELSAENVRLEHLLAVRGVIETDETSLEASPELLAAIDKGMHSTLEKLLHTRLLEGSHLKTVLVEHLAQIDKLTNDAKAEAAKAPHALRDKLIEQLKELTKQSLGEDRLAQEAALLASKADITEEINRLHGHVAAVRSLLNEGGSVGRKLDFMCQELNREANTLCSKSTTLALTNIGVELKVIIEQFREQVQNVE